MIDDLLDGLGEVAGAVVGGAVELVGELGSGVLEGAVDLVGDIFEGGSDTASPAGEDEEAKKRAGGAEHA